MQPATDSPPWTVPLAAAEVPETGRHVTLTADEATRAAVARLAGVRDIPQLDAVFDLARRGRDGLHVTGTVTARVGQDCVVTLEPMESEVAEPVDVLYLPPEMAAARLGNMDDEQAESGPDIAPLDSDHIDLGALAMEFLLLAIDPYPRKPGAEFLAPAAEDETPHPFAVLAALRRNGGE